MPTNAADADAGRRGQMQACGCGSASASMQVHAGQLQAGRRRWAGAGGLADAAAMRAGMQACSRAATMQLRCCKLAAAAFAAGCTACWQQR